MTEKRRHSEGRHIFGLSFQATGLFYFECPKEFDSWIKMPMFARCAVSTPVCGSWNARFAITVH